MPQDLPHWAEPAAPPRRDRPFDRPDPNEPSPPPSDGLSWPETSDPAQPQVWPAPGEDCGTCDVSGLTINETDCDEEPDICELICCNAPFPEECRAAYSEQPCAIPLGGEWILVVAALTLAIWKLT